MSVFELLSYPFRSRTGIEESYGVILPQYCTKGQLHYPSPKTKLGYLAGDAVMWGSVYYLSKYFGWKFLETKTGKIVFMGGSILNILSYIIKRGHEHQIRNDILTLLSRNNANNYYQKALPENDNKSFDLILLNQKQMSGSPLMDATVNNAPSVKLDYYPNGRNQEKLPHFKNPVIDLYINHFNSRAKDLGWLHFPTHLYPKLKTLIMKVCGILYTMDFSKLDALERFEMTDIVLDSNYKYYWNKFPSLKYLKIIYEKTAFTEGISLSKDQSLASLEIGFSRKFSNLTPDEHICKNNTLLQDLPDKINNLTLKNLVINDTIDLGNRQIEVLTLSNCKLNPGWNISGNVNKLILEKSQVTSLPKLSITPKVIGGYCLDLDQVQLVDYYWYPYKFFWDSDPPSLSLEIAQKYLDQELVKISLPDSVDEIDNLSNSITSDDLEFDQNNNGYGILQILTRDRDRYRLYQVYLPKDDQEKVSELEALVNQNNDLLIIDRRTDLKKLLKNKQNHLESFLKKASNESENES